MPHTVCVSCSSQTTCLRIFVPPFERVQQLSIRIHPNSTILQSKTTSFLPIDVNGEAWSVDRGLSDCCCLSGVTLSPTELIQIRITRSFTNCESVESVSKPFNPASDRRCPTSPWRCQWSFNPTHPRRVNLSRLWFESFHKMNETATYVWASSNTRLAILKYALLFT